MSQHMNLQNDSISIVVVDTVVRRNLNGKNDSAVLMAQGYHLQWVYFQRKCPLIFRNHLLIASIYKMPLLLQKTLHQTRKKITASNVCCFRIRNLLEIIFEEVFQNHHTLNSLPSRSSVFFAFCRHHESTTNNFVTDSGQVGLLTRRWRKILVLWRSHSAAAKFPYFLHFTKK